ncbi:uncharacterized protein LOC111264135 [Varroa jacobsoni]|nr:uncharacterized protein LOC111243046 isoform X2 [Varroa destructor]XP_022643881.1 uncharacterized protein LOC111243046 isoform X2 [Varroa destructor]XP_022695484.1 uncharacterized protein LOC111264135 [Varroa jacobsoni]XP_022695491.1 uncharacterized protein LOC111264135 [Varroa jacobsoni]XP_022695501.1 uncharacterized protein LOC111264135 [Varroa jacobsoni]XP_022695511.1 uncharacterized protein LOC111264135 [Varroa jacobsoni]XP_022695521.1 uncharacterized protein LOC111264135 [Varroa jacob
MPTSSSSSNDKNAPGSSSSMANNNSISNSGTCGAVLRDSNNGNGSGTASSSNNTNTGSALTSGGFVGATRSGNSIVGSNGGNIINIDNTNTGNNTSRSTNSPSSHYWGNGAFIVQHKFTRAKSYYIDDEGRPKADPKQLRWSASDPEVMELVTGSGVYIKLFDLVNVYYRTKNAISAARRLLVCVFNDQTLIERSVKGSPDRPGLCPITHQAILDCVEMISQCKPPDWAADETMINRSLIVRLCELRSKRTAKIYVTSQPNPTAHPGPFPESYLS